jgi:hypothetical protein
MQNRLIIPLGILSTLLPAQTAPRAPYNPLPVRVALERYGHPGSHAPVPVAWIDLSTDHHTGPRAEIQGGWPGESALLMFGTRPADLRLGDSARIYVDPASALFVYGCFDLDGRFSVPLDLPMLQRATSTLYYQGVRIRSDGIDTTLLLSGGIRLDLHPGNAQCRLDYDGPDLLVTPVRERFEDADLANVRLRVDIPNSHPGNELVFDRVVSQGGVTRCELTLIEHASGPAVIAPVYVAIDLGQVADPWIQVWVRREIRPTGDTGVNQLAARIDLRY